MGKGNNKFFKKKNTYAKLASAKTNGNVNGNMHEEGEDKDKPKKKHYKRDLDLDKINKQQEGIKDMVGEYKEMKKKEKKKLEKKKNNQGNEVS